MGRFKEFFIQESPDRINNGKELYHSSKEAFPFGYYHGKFYFDKSMNGKTHFKMLEKFLQDGDQNLAREVQKSGQLDSTDMKSHGRFWLISKTISFWDYPSKSDFHKVISELKSRGIPINSSWKVEVYDSKEDAALDQYSKFIPIDEYGNESKGHKSNQLDHLLPPSQKNKVMKHKGVKTGSEVMASKVPKNMSIAQYNSMKQTSESILDESIQSKLAKESGLKHIGHGTYKNSLGDEFKWEKNHFKKIEKESNKTIPQKLSSGGKIIKHVDLKSLNGEKIKELDYHVFVDNIVKAYKDKNFDVIKHVAKELNRPYEAALQDIKNQIDNMKESLDEEISNVKYKIIKDFGDNFYVLAILKNAKSNLSKNKYIPLFRNKIKESDMIGYTSISTKGGEPYVVMVEVDPKFRRQNIASSMYKFYETSTKTKIVRNMNQTSLGKLFADKYFKNKLDEEISTTVAPISVSTGQFQSKLGSVAKRKEPKLINDIKDKVKKKLKDKKVVVDESIKEKSMKMTIVITWEDEDIKVGPDRGRDLGKQSKVEKFKIAKAYIWKNNATEKDLEKAKENVNRPESLGGIPGQKIFTYPTSEKDPLGKAKKEILKDKN